MRVLRPFAVSLCTLFLAATASAVPITFGFQATVTSIADGPAGFTAGLGIGNTFTGTFTFDSTTADADADPAVGEYQGALTGATATFPDGVLLLGVTGTGANQIVVRTASDGYDVERLDFGGASTYDGHLLLSGLLDLGATAIFADDSLPLAPPVISGGSVRIELVRSSDLASIQVLATLDSLSPVPEPGLLGLLGLGLAGVAVRRRLA